MNNHLPAISILVALAVACLLPGCGSSPSDPGGGDDPTGPVDAEWPEGGLGLPDLGEAALESLVIRYQELRAVQDAASARASLLAELEDWDDLLGAKLLSDGTSIQLVFIDSTRAGLFTDEDFLGPPRSGYEGPISIAAKNELPELIRVAAGRSDCGNIKTPSSHRVHIVNMAGGIKQSTLDLTAEVRQHFIDMGWDPDDVVITQREEWYDRSFVPDSMFEQEGYGIVLFIGQGGMIEDAAGQEHYSLECFYGGKRHDGYEDYVTEERWDEYVDWFHNDGTLHANAAYSPDAGRDLKEVYIRDDLLAEQIKLDEGAMVHIIASSSWEAVDAMTEAGAGHFTGWSGHTDHEQGVDAYKLYMENMVRGDDGAPMDAYNASDNLDGLDIYFGESGMGMMVSTVDGTDFMLPAQMRFDAPFDCMEEGTVYYDVNVSYPDCPSLNTSFQFFPGGEFELTGLPPVGAEIELTARDSEGSIVGRGDYELALQGGPNDVDLCPCDGSLEFAVGDRPPGADNLDVTIHYHDPDIPSVEVETGLASPVIEGLVPGAATVDVIAREGGWPVGGYSLSTEITCDGTLEYVCFGWFTFEVVEIPETAATVEIMSDSPGADPNPLIMDPWEIEDMVGFWWQQEVNILAEAKADDGEVVGSVELTEYPGCGSNLISLEFDRYGVALTAVPDTVLANGWSRSTVTATVRYFTDFDTNVPSGDPIPGKTVLLSTDFGDWVDDIFWGDTDENGEVVAHITSEVGGMATIWAEIEGGTINSEPATVVFKPRLGIYVDNRAGDYTGVACYNAGLPSCFHVNCVTERIDINGESLYDIPLDGEYFTYWDFVLPEIGDTLVFEFDPLYGCPDPEADPPMNESFISSVHLHYYIEGNYSQQISQQLFNAHVPLSGTVEVEVILQDPRDP